MVCLLGVVRPRWLHLPRGRSRQAGLDILATHFFENLRRSTPQAGAQDAVGTRPSSAWSAASAWACDFVAGYSSP
jgi:hypothetical protein